MSLPVSPRRSLIATAVAALLAMLGLAFVPSSGHAAFSTAQCQGAGIDGVGASFANTAQAAWKEKFKAFCGGFAPPITYAGTGSGAGLEAMGARRGGNVDGSKSRTGVARFAGTDDPPTPTQVNDMNRGTDAVGDEGAIQVIPAAVGAVAPLVNFPNDCDVDLLPVNEKTAEQNKDADGTPDDVVRVLFSKTKWEAAWRKDAAADNWQELFPALAADPDCDKPIIRVVRFDASGTTFAFKSYLQTIDATTGWNSTYESGGTAKDNRNWPSSTFGPRADCTGTPSGPGSSPADQLTSGCTSGAGALATKVREIDGSIGYADVATARGQSPSFAIDPEADDNDTYWTQLQNGSGAFTEPTADPDGFRSDGAKGANCASTVFTGVPASTYGDWSKASGVNAALGYGLCTMTYGLVFEDNAPVWGVSAGEESKARTVKDYWENIVSDGGQGVLFANDYSPLPANMLAISRAGVATIDWNKQGLGGNPGGGEQPGGGGGTTPPPVDQPKPAPSNLFSVPSTKLDSKKGSATFSIRLPGAGQLAVKGTNGKGKKRITVGSLRRSVSKAGTVKITLAPGSKAMKALKRKGTLKVNVTITFTPQGGSARSSSKTVTLKYTAPKKGKGKGKS